MASSDTTDGTSYMRRQCSTGYYGPACSLCVRNATHSYGRTGSAKCRLCRSKRLVVLAYIASTVLVVLFLCYTVQATLSENGENPAATLASDSVTTSEVLRVGASAFQRHWQLPFPVVSNKLFSKLAAMLLNASHAALFCIGLCFPLFKAVK